MNQRTVTAFTALRDLEGYIASQLWRFQQSGGRMDAAFARALADLHAVLALGLDRVEPRRCRPSRAASLPLSVACAAHGARAAAERAAPAPDPAADDDYLIDYAEEICCLNRERKLLPKFAPQRLRFESGRPNDDLD